MNCYKCGKENAPAILYCQDCGNQLKGPKIDYTDENKKYFTQTLLLFLCIVIVILSPIVVKSVSIIKEEYIFHGLLLSVVLIFCAFDFNGIVKIFRRSLNLKLTLKISLEAIALAVLVTIIAGALAFFFNLNTIQYFELFINQKSYAFIYGFLFIAILPGFIEELLFRGVLFNHLLRLTTPRSTILITAILFSFVHFSLFSLLWLFPIGLALGYFRYRYRTIWYSIFFHTIYNGSIFLLDFLLAYYVR